tara:strand:+ start:189 stop:491 length:303 start_codon:yes stop_codon:yes gene_type:complete
MYLSSRVLPVCLLLIVISSPLVLASLETLELIREAKFADLLGSGDEMSLERAEEGVAERGEEGRRTIAKRNSPWEGSGCSLRNNSQEVVVVFDSRCKYML